jgi:GntR family transcriptional regulator, rspAB operon transcriptional repressor
MSTNDNTEPVKNQAYRSLRRAIIMGHLRPNEKLNIQQLAESYGASITPVRDALHMLGHEGLVTIKPRSGYFVTKTTLKELRDMLELREILEIAAATLAAQRIREEDIQKLDSVHAGYSGDDDESYDRYTEENRTFHFLIAEASGNQQLAEALGHLHDRLARFMVLRHGGLSQIETHATIVAALRTRDVDAARQAVLNEITETRDRILERAMDEGAATWHIDTY